MVFGPAFSVLIRPSKGDISGSMMKSTLRAWSISVTTVERFQDLHTPSETTLGKNIEHYFRCCFGEINLFSSPCPRLAAAWTRAVCTTSCRWRRGSQSLTLRRKNYDFQIYLCKVLFLNRRRKKWNLFLLTVGGDGVGVRVLVAGLRQLVQLHVVHHHLGNQRSKC